MELRINSLLSVTLFWKMLYISNHIYKTTAHSVIEINRVQANPVQVRTRHSVYSYPGQTLELQCTDDDGDEEVMRWWQTPFGLFEGCNIHSKDPVKTCNGSLRISRVSTSHDGLYFCVHQDKTGRIILPYSVNVVGLNPDVKELVRNTREAEVYDNTVSDSHFVAALTSSVIVTFFVALTLGAFSRSYVIKCIQMARAHMPRRNGRNNNSNVQPNTNNTQAARSETVHFHKNQDTGEDTVDIAESQVIEDSTVEENERDGDVDATENEPQPQSVEEQNQEFKAVLSPHPKKKTRVIKVYNYDEEGNRYSHIKDSGVEDENEVRPRVRTKSLTRLNAIMTQAESIDFNPVQESTDGQSATQNAPYS